jgi:ACS family hexuronate transporter-like MFS transporter
MLFLATTINYMDRQVLSLTWKDFIAPDFHWTDADYGNIAAIFGLVYAVANLFSGRFMDWIGVKKGYLWAIAIWSLGACMHALCGVATMWHLNLGSMQEMIEATGDVALAISTVSAWCFMVSRVVLAVGESGNFPAAIKVTAEYFPKKDRAFATSIFNSGSTIGALVAPLSIPLLARYFKNAGIGGGWEMAFIIIGALGFIWLAFWIFIYQKPEESKRVNAAELAYIHQDETSEKEAAQESKSEKGAIPMLSNSWIYFTLGIIVLVCAFMFSAWLLIPAFILLNVPFWNFYKLPQTWAIFLAKLVTDGVWWFFLFWAPAYFSDQYGYTSDSAMGIMLIFTLYFIVTVLSIGGGYLPKYFVESKGMNPYAGRMRAMFIFACFPVLGLFAQPLGAYSAWWPAILIGLLGAGHQAWSANIFSTVGDMFPKSTIGTIVGLGTMAGGLGSMSINLGSGKFFDWAAEQGAAFSFFGFDGKPAAYMVVFCICAVAYLIGWCIMKALVPKYKPITLDD